MVAVRLIGVTLTSLAIGLLGEATFAKLFQAIWPGSLGAHTALFAHAIALACAFALLSALHVVIGSLVPEHFSLGHPFARSGVGRDCKGFGSQFSAGSWCCTFDRRAADPSPTSSRARPD